MPVYEMSLILRNAPKAKLVESIKEVALEVVNHGGVVRKMEALKNRALPVTMKSKEGKHTEGIYFLMNVNLSTDKLLSIKDELSRNSNLLRAMVAIDNKIKKPVCTLEEELKPPLQRPAVQKMIEEGKRVGRSSKVKKFNPKTGLDFNPIIK